MPNPTMHEKFRQSRDAFVRQDRYCGEDRPERQAYY
jgi:hypothetical protein